ncbi:MORN repeat-containing protein 1 isoform X3 [Antechinus flavipes]|uniref:MORN repeat-containing protein 1 isoform X3 n=1 Tax=Antechinus flavipes TaxID=38775 RepID=UPI002235F0BF|nr:MORN repeat-containing protein 1 isoform X3 [Antechinus flavipes]
MASPNKEPDKSRSPYQGSMRGMVRDGYGHYLYQNAFFRYEGEWKDGKKHGHGKLLFKDGSYYDGEFVDGEIFGMGQRYWSSTGNTYTGQFVLGELHGHGVMIYKEGGKYEGEFYQGMREGPGTLTDKNGQVYQGTFHENKKHGVGQMTFNNGDNYEGDWILDQRQGHGVMHYADGSIYKGQWRNNVFNGQGLMIHCSGIIYDGLWINGYPATQASKIVILGPTVIEMVQGSSITLKVQLQTDDGEVVRSESGRALKIWAGVRYVQLSAFSNFCFFKVTGDAEVKPIQTPFGFDCIAYPLTLPAPGDPEMGASKSEHPEDDSCFQKEDLEPESLLESLLYRAKDDPDDQDAPPPEYHPIMFLDNIPNEEEDQQSQEAESSDNTEDLEEPPESRDNSPPQEKEPYLSQPPSPSDGSSLMAYAGEYVIMVQEITTPPFLGKTLPTAFVHLKVVPKEQQPPPEDP